MPNRSLHQRSGRVERLHRLLDEYEKLGDEVAKAASLLGGDHRLVRILDVVSVLRRQLLVSSLALIGGMIALSAGTSWAVPVTVGASVVEVALVAALAAVASSRRCAVRDVLIDASTDLPLPALERERRRLTDPRTQNKLARSLDRVVDIVATWRRIYRNSRPVFDVRVVRPATPLLSEIATLLRAQSAPPRALARIERLLTSGASALYGDDPVELRHELELIIRQLKGQFRSEPWPNRR